MHIFIVIDLYILSLDYFKRMPTIYIYICQSNPGIVIFFMEIVIPGC